MDANQRTRLFSTIGIVLIVAGLGYAGLRMFGAVGSRISDWTGSGPERGAPERTPGDERAAERATIGVDLQADLRDFDRVHAEGGWKVTIRPGEFGVAVSVSEHAADDVRVYRRGDVLHLSVASGIRTVTGTMEAEITMPTLDHLEIDGGADVRLEGVDSRELTIDVDGAASIHAIDARVEELHVDVDGAANVDFSRSSVVNAEVDMDGASNMNITMAGGRLTGVLRGVGNVSYSGPVSEEAVRVEGLGRVRQR